MKFCFLFSCSIQKTHHALVVVAGIKKGVDSATQDEFNEMASTGKRRKPTVAFPGDNDDMPTYYYRKGLDDILKDMCP